MKIFKKLFFKISIWKKLFKHEVIDNTEVKNENL